MTNNFVRAALCLTFALAAPLAAQSRPLPRWTLVEERRIGSATDTTSGLQQPEYLAIGTDGRIYVYDAGPKRIKIFESSGEFVRSVGRPGDGPGEFRNVLAMGLLGDTIWTSDRGGSRVTLFPAKGGPRTFRVAFDPRHPGFAANPPTAMLSNGLAVAQSLTSFDGSDTLARLPSPIVRMRRSGAVVDTIAAPPAGATGAVLRSPSRAERIILTQFFPQVALWGAVPNGHGIVVVSRTAAASARESVFTVRQIDADGRDVFVREFPYLPIPLPQIVRDTLADVRRLIGARGSEFQSDYRAKMIIPDFLPPVNAVLVGTDAIWLQREQHSQGGLIWNIVDARGEMLAEVLAPKDLVILYGDRTMLYGAVADADGIPWIVRYRVTQGPR